jgi:hypothetical protein
MYHSSDDRSSKTGLLMSTILRVPRYILFKLTLWVAYMYTRMISISGSIVVVLFVTATSGVVEASNRNGAGDRGYGAGHRTMTAAGSTAGTEHHAPEQNRYRYQHQNRQREHNGSTNWTVDSADSGKGQYSNDKYLSQKDFQAWLHQNLEQTGQRLQYREEAESLAADGF